MRTAQNGSMKRIGQLHIIDKYRLAREEGNIFPPPDRCADVLRGQLTLLNRLNYAS